MKDLTRFQSPSFLFLLRKPAFSFGKCVLHLLCLNIEPLYHLPLALQLLLRLRRPVGLDLKLPHSFTARSLEFLVLFALFVVASSLVGNEAI